MLVSIPTKKKEIKKNSKFTDLLLLWLQIVYSWLLSVSGVSGLIAWLGITASHYRFRKAFVAQGRDLNDLPFKARLFPFGTIFAFVVCLFITIGQGYSTWFASPIVAADIVASYIGIPVVLAFYIGYKVVKRTSVIPIHEVDLDSGREEIIR